MTENRKLAVVAVGGNALIREKGKESLPDQYAAACLTMPHVVDMIQNGWNVIVTHGNGPQVGFILRRVPQTHGFVASRAKKTPDPLTSRRENGCGRSRSARAAASTRSSFT